MADGRHLGEIDKSRYLHDGLTDLDGIWHDDAYWTPGRHPPSKFALCKKTKMADDNYRKQRLVVEGLGLVRVNQHDEDYLVKTTSGLVQFCGGDATFCQITCLLYTSDAADE